MTFPAGPQAKIVGTPLFAASGFEVPATSVQQAQNDLIDYRDILATVAATFRGNASESLLTQTLEDAYTGNTESPILKAARLDPFTVQNLTSTLTPAELNELFATRIYDTTMNLDSVAQDSFKLANGDIPLTTLDPRFTLARLLLQGQVGDLDDVARSTFKGTAFSMVPLAGNFVAAGQALSIEQEKSLLIGLRDIGFLSPTALAQRQTAAVLEQQLAAGGILL